MLSLRLVLCWPVGCSPVGVVSRTCLANSSWDILNTRPKQNSWDRSAERKGSTFRELRISQLRTLSQSVTTLRKSPTLHLRWSCFPSVITQDSWPQVRIDTKKRSKNWQFCGYWKSPSWDNRAIKLTQNYVWYNNQCINHLVPPSIICEFHSEVIKLLRLLQCTVAQLHRALAWVLKRHNTFIYLVLRFIPSWSYTDVNRSSGCWRRFSEDAIVAISRLTLRWMCDSPRTGCAWRVIMACDLYCCLLPQCEALRTCRSGLSIATQSGSNIRKNCWSCSIHQGHIRRLSYCCLSNSYRIWRELVTAHPLVGVQNPRWTVVIYLRRHRHKRLSRNAMTFLLPLNELLLSQLGRTRSRGRCLLLGGCVPVSGMNVRSLVGLSAHSAFHRWSAQCAARMLLLSNEMMSCCAAGKNGVSIWDAVHSHSVDR